MYTSILRKEMFFVIVQKQQQYMTGHASFWAVSSKTSDRLLKRPDDHNYYVVSRWDVITSWWPAAERRCCLEAVVETGTQHAARYRGVTYIAEQKKTIHYRGEINSLIRQHDFNTGFGSHYTMYSLYGYMYFKFSNNFLTIRIPKIIVRVAFPT